MMQVREDPVVTRAMLAAVLCSLGVSIMAVCTSAMTVPAAHNDTANTPRLNNDTAGQPSCSPLPRIVDQEQNSYALWMRYTQPRLMSSANEHPDETVVRGSLEQILDHYDPMSSTWTQRYYRNSHSYVPGGPAFVMVSGTARYSSDWLRDGHMADLARKYQADRYFLNTRFYDPISPPTADASVDSLQYLSTEQVVQDIRVFLEHLTERGLLQPGQRVVLFGAGYGGAVATWARQRYPDLILGVVASSATVDVRYEVASYFRVVTEAVNWYHKNSLKCEDFLRRAFIQFDQALSTSSGRQSFNEYFQPCSPLAENETLSEEDRAHIMGLVAGVFADQVQEDEDGPLDDRERPGGDKLYPYCYVLALSTDSVIRTLGLLLSDSAQGRCLEASYEGLRRKLNSSEWGSEANMAGVRPWLWQQCTELGQFPSTSDSRYSFPYSTRISMDFYRKLCIETFGESVMEDLLPNIRNLQNTYGGKNPKASNLIFVKGDLDPWKSLSPDNDFKGDEVYVYSVLRASHAHDMFPRDDYDPPWMKSARRKIANVIGQWLQYGAKKEKTKIN